METVRPQNLGQLLRFYLGRPDVDLLQLVLNYSERQGVDRQLVLNTTDRDSASVDNVLVPLSVENAKFNFFVFFPTSDATFNRPKH